MEEMCRMGENMNKKSRQGESKHICEYCWYLMHPGCKWMDENIPNEPWAARKVKAPHRYDRYAQDRYHVTNCHQYRPLDYEHTKAKDLDDTAAKRLMDAVVAQAVKEYRSSLIKRKYHGDTDILNGKIISLENFFRSDWFYALTEMDGERLIAVVKNDLGV